MQLQVTCPKGHLSEMLNVPVQIPKFDAKRNPKPNPSLNPNSNPNHNLALTLTQTLTLTLEAVALTLTLCLCFSDMQWKTPKQSRSCFFLFWGVCELVLEIKIISLGMGVGLYPCKAETTDCSSSKWSKQDPRAHRVRVG